MNKTLLLTIMAMSPMFVIGQENQETEENGVKTIHLRQNNAQIAFDSKMYELKNASAEEILPFIKSAILRYNRNSNIRCVKAKGTKDALLVSTGKDFIPYVDDLIKALDQSNQVDNNGSVISGTGVSRIAYTPQYRAAFQFSEIIDDSIGSHSGASYVNGETNTIFWRDQADAAQRTLSWVKQLDRPLPQVDIRMNYYELRDSELKDWGFDYLAWKNGPGVNIFNVGYNAGHMVVDEVLSAIPYAASSTWGLGGFFTAPMFDLSFIRCLQQSGCAFVTANTSLTVVNTPVRSQEDYLNLVKHQAKNLNKAPYIYNISMIPEYQNIGKNILGRTLVGKSYYEDEQGNMHGDPPAFTARIVNPFVCLAGEGVNKDIRGFIPNTLDYYKTCKTLSHGGVIFHYSLNFKNVVERGNVGSELSNSTIFSGAATLGFGKEKVLAVYEKENDVEQTIGIPIVCRIPVIKYLFSTVTTIKERTYIVVTAEATPVHPNFEGKPEDTSISTVIDRRIENPFKNTEEKQEQSSEESSKESKEVK